MSETTSRYKVCPVCKETFFFNHGNRIYCQDTEKNCKIRHNNEKARNKRDETKRLDNVLHNNRWVLQHYYRNRADTLVSRAAMERFSFNFDCFTGTKEDPDTGETYIVVFEYAYCLADNGIKIIKL